MGKKRVNKKFNPVLAAVEKMGSQYCLAKAMGVEQPNISLWQKQGRFPPRRVIQVEKITGISRYQLDPLMYPMEAKL